MRTLQGGKLYFCTPLTTAITLAQSGTFYLVENIFFLYYTNPDFPGEMFFAKENTNKFILSIENFYFN